MSSPDIVRMKNHSFLNSTKDQIFVFSVHSEYNEYFDSSTSSTLKCGNQLDKATFKNGLVRIGANQIKVEKMLMSAEADKFDFSLSRLI